MSQIPYSHQHIDATDIKAVLRVLRSDWLTQGPNVEAFEKALCRYTGASYAVAVSSGTAALHLACLAAGFNKSDEVIVPANTFAATANACVYVGAKPVFVDIDPLTGNMTYAGVLKALTKKTRGIIPVDFAGSPCQWDKLAALARKRGLITIDDASHALGAKYKHGQQWYEIGCCQHATMTTLSFHPLKSITTAEGGAILTNRRDVYEKLLVLRNHGITKDKAKFIKPRGRLAREEYFMQMQQLGFNYRMTDLQCALGVTQLERLNDFIKQRKAIKAFYRKAFAGNPFFNIVQEPDNVQSAHHLCVIQLNDASRRTALIDLLRARGLGVQIHYMPVYWHPFYQDLGYRDCYAPQAEDFYRRAISLPIYPGLSGRQQKHVVKVVLKACQELLAA